MKWAEVERTIYVKLGGHKKPGTKHDQGLLEDYRVLCRNCNSSYSYYGYCPHKDVEQ